MYLSGSRSWSWSMMSWRTRRVALAVNAAIGHSGKCSRSRLNCRYSGRNSWPHSEMQCASSIAKSEIGTRSEPFERVCARQALRRNIEQPILPFARLANHRGLLRFRERAVQQRLPRFPSARVARPDPASARSAAKPRRRFVPAASRPAIGSTAICLRRWASPRKCRGLPAGCARFAPAGDETSHIPSSGAAAPEALLR